MGAYERNQTAQALPLWDAKRAEQRKLILVLDEAEGEVDEADRVMRSAIQRRDEARAALHALDAEVRALETKLGLKR